MVVVYYIYYNFILYLLALLKKTAMSKSNVISKNMNKETGGNDLKKINLSSKASVISESDSKSVVQLKKNLQK